jgi:methyl-accepting chemotaxis protein
MKAVLSVRFTQVFTDRVARRLSAPGQLLHAQLSGSTLDGRAPASQFLVVTPNGLLIAETRSGHARGRIMQPEINLLTDASLTHLNLSYDGSRSGSFIGTRQAPQNRQDGAPAPSYLVAYARSASRSFYAPSIENFAGFDWMIIGEAPNLSNHTVLPGLAGTQLDDQQGWIRDVLWVSAALCVVFLFSSIILCWLFGKWVLRPVRALTNRVQRMEQGHITGRIELPSKGEFAELAAALDRIRNMITKMADRLQRTAAGRTNT